MTLGSQGEIEAAIPGNEIIFFSVHMTQSHESAWTGPISSKAAHLFPKWRVSIVSSTGDSEIQKMCKIISFSWYLASMLLPWSRWLPGFLRQASFERQVLGSKHCCLYLVATTCSGMLRTSLIVEPVHYRPSVLNVDVTRSIGMFSKIEKRNSQWYIYKIIMVQRNPTRGTTEKQVARCWC